MNRKLVRWLILTLLLGNAVLYFWPQPTRTSARPPHPPGVAELVLLEESAAASPVDRLVDAAPTQTDIVAAADAAAADVAAADVAAADAAAAGAAPEMTAADAETALAMDADVTAGIDAEPAAAEEPEATPAQVCWRAGPIESSALSNALNADFRRRGVEMNLVLQRIAVEPDYWVHLPTGGTPEAIRDWAGRLRQRGIEFFPITDGELSGDLSLGLFRSPDGARALRERLRAQGFPAEIFERPRSREEAWLALTGADLEALGWVSVTGYLRDYPQLQLQSRECP